MGRLRGAMACRPQVGGGRVQDNVRAPTPLRLPDAAVVCVPLPPLSFFLLAFGNFSPSLPSVIAVPLACTGVQETGRPAVPLFSPCRTGTVGRREVAPCQGLAVPRKALQLLVGVHGRPNVPGSCLRDIGRTALLGHVRQPVALRRPPLDSGT